MHETLVVLEEIWSTGYHIDDVGYLVEGKLRLFRELKDEGRAWAIERANAFPTDATHQGAPIKVFIFLALVRAKVPIEPKWDHLFPLVTCARDELLTECARAIPKERRAAALQPHFASLRCALDLVGGLPTADMARAFILAERPDSPRRKWAIKSMKELGKKHPEVAAVAKELAKGAPKEIELRVSSARVVTKASELTKLEKEQLRIGARGYDEQDLDAEARLSSEDDETALGKVDIRTIGDAKGNALYESFTYLGDAGVIFRVGTTEEIGWVGQGGVVLKDANTALQQALQTAVLSRAKETPKKKAKPAPKKKPGPKKKVTRR